MSVGLGFFNRRPTRVAMGANGRGPLVNGTLTRLVNLFPTQRCTSTSTATCAMGRGLLPRQTSFNATTSTGSRHAVTRVRDFTQETECYEGNGYPEGLVGNGTMDTCHEAV